MPGIGMNGGFYMSKKILTTVVGFLLVAGMLTGALTGCNNNKNPDGSEIIFNQDYFGDHREAAAMPGPFATEDAWSRMV